MEYSHKPSADNEFDSSTRINVEVLLPPASQWSRASETYQLLCHSSEPSACWQSNRQCPGPGPHGTHSLGHRNPSSPLLKTVATPTEFTIGADRPYPPHHNLEPVIDDARNADRGTVLQLTFQTAVTDNR